MQFRSLGQEDPLEEGAATHSVFEYSCLDNLMDRRSWRGKALTLMCNIKPHLARVRHN